MTPWSLFAPRHPTGEAAADFPLRLSPRLLFPGVVPKLALKSICHLLESRVLNERCTRRTFLVYGHMACAMASLDQAVVLPLRHVARRVAKGVRVAGMRLIPAVVDRLYVYSYRWHILRFCWTQYSPPECFGAIPR